MHKSQFWSPLDRPLILSTYAFGVDTMAEVCSLVCADSKGR